LTGGESGGTIPLSLIAIGPADLLGAWNQLLEQIPFVRSDGTQTSAGCPVSATSAAALSAPLLDRSAPFLALLFESNRRQRKRRTIGDGLRLHEIGSRTVSGGNTKRPSSKPKSDGRRMARAQEHAESPECDFGVPLESPLILIIKHLRWFFKPPRYSRLY